MTDLLTRAKRLPSEVWLGGVAVTLIALMIWAAVASARAFETSCDAKGGHVKTVTHTNTGLGMDGKPVTTTDSTSYCLSDDGRILDIQ